MPRHGGRIRSLGREATCFDNTVAESLFATYEDKLIRPDPWNDLSELHQATFV